MPCCPGLVYSGHYYKWSVLKADWAELSGSIVQVLCLFWYAAFLFSQLLSEVLTLSRWICPFVFPVLCIYAPCILEPGSWVWKHGGLLWLLGELTLCGGTWPSCSTVTVSQLAMAVANHLGKWTWRRKCFFWLLVSQDLACGGPAPEHQSGVPGWGGLLTSWPQGSKEEERKDPGSQPSSKATPSDLTSFC